MQLIIIEPLKLQFWRFANEKSQFLSTVLLKSQPLKSENTKAVLTIVTPLKHRFKNSTSLNADLLIIRLKTIVSPLFATIVSFVAVFFLGLLTKKLSLLTNFLYESKFCFIPRSSKRDLIFSCFFKICLDLSVKLELPVSAYP